MRKEAAENLLREFHVLIHKSSRLSAPFLHERCRGEKTKVMMASKCRVLHTWPITRGGEKNHRPKRFLVEYSY